MVTGASSGIGAAYARRLAELGYSLTLVARRKDRLDALADSLRSDLQADVEVEVADLENLDHLQRLEGRLEQQGFAGLVNNAGAGGLGPITAASSQALERNIRLNVVALAHLSRAALAGFKDRGAGFLVNIGSILAFAPSPAATAYSGSKAFVLNFTRSLQLEFAESDIRIQLIMPGPIRTEFFSSQGMDGSVFPASSYLTAEQLVGAAMAGLEAGEAVSFPSLASLEGWEQIEGLRKQMVGATLSGAVAERAEGVGDPERVGAQPAPQQVVADAADDDVIAVIAVDRIDPGQARHDVVPAVALKVVGPAVAGPGGVGCALQLEALDLGGQGPGQAGADDVIALAGQLDCLV
eukprot:gene12832-12624_t